VEIGGGSPYRASKEERLLNQIIGRLAAVALAFGLAGSGAAAQAPSDWPQPNVDSLPAGPYKDVVTYGRKLFNETYSIIGPEVSDPRMRYSGNNLACQSCHLSGGTQRFSLPMIGVYGAFPTYMGRENEVRTLEERIEGCMERSMNGRELPLGGDEMKALLAYIQFLSSGMPVGKPTEGRGSPRLALLDRAADPRRGADVYARNCAVCHQADGQGKRRGTAGDAKGYLFPPLWGPDSFNNGAGMHRLISSASFIHASMPLGTRYDAPALSVEDAWDVAAYINSQPRPTRANLDRDYPNRARKPVDAPFPPFADRFSPEQHKYGPFKPLLDAQKAASASSN
jgi:thiosulfate dehydrogenase